MKKFRNMSRRKFLKTVSATAAGVTCFPYIVTFAETVADFT
ncbi:MAG: twin-arginine translocation signal domain-containing protein [Planctomycetota bacterium]